MLLVQILDLEQNDFLTLLVNNFVSVHVPPCKYVALQQVDLGQVGGGVVVVGAIVVVDGTVVGVGSLVVVGFQVVVDGIVGVVGALVVVVGALVVVVGVAAVVVVVVDIGTGVSPAVVVVIVGSIVVVVTLTGQHRQGPCPAKGVHLLVWQLSSSTVMFSFAIFSSTHTCPGRAAEHFRSSQFWQQKQGICKPGGSVPPPPPPGIIIGGNCLFLRLSGVWLQSFSAVQTPSLLVICGIPTSTVVQWPPYGKYLLHSGLGEHWLLTRAS